jgi:hypothetical protein
MKDRIQRGSWILCAVTATVLASAPYAVAQAHPAAAPSMQAPSEQDVASTQEQFLKLLRLSPVLTTVVARDPSLLADQQYVERNNPELAQFMAAHPDIAKNPEFYLFSHLEQGHGRREQALERAVWPDLTPGDRQPSQATMVMHELIPIIIVPCVFLAIVWVIRIFVESRRWTRAFKLQSEVHSRLFDRRRRHEPAIGRDSLSGFCPGTRRSAPPCDERSHSPALSRALLPVAALAPASGGLTRNPGRCLEWRRSRRVDRRGPRGQFGNRIREYHWSDRQSL